MKNNSSFMRLTFLFCLLVLAVSPAFSQKRNKAVAKTAKANTLKALSPEQKEFVQRMIDCTNEIETAFVTNSRQIADITFLFCEIASRKIDNASLPEPINKYARATHSIYLDLGVFYGRTTNTGLYNSTRNLQRSLGDQSSDEVAPIISTYKLQGLSSAQAIQKIRTSAITAKNLLQNTLAKSPTDSSESRIIPKSDNTKAVSQAEGNNTLPSTNGGDDSILAGILEASGARNSKTQAQNAKTAETNFLKMSVGKWHLTSQTGGSKLAFDLNIYQENEEYYCGLSEPGKSTQIRIKIQSSDNNFVINFPVAVPIQGQNFFFKFLISKIEAEKMSGLFVMDNRRGIELSAPLEATRFN